MNAYKFVVSGVVAVVMAEDDEAVINKMFGHLEKAREGEHCDPDAKPYKITQGGIRRLDDGGPDGMGTIVTRIEVWSDGTRFLPPEGEMN